MKTLTIKVKSKAAENILLSLEDLHLLKIEKEKPKATEKFKRKIKKQLEEGFREIKLHEEGKIKMKSLDELINEL